MLRQQLKVIRLNTALEHSFFVCNLEATLDNFGSDLVPSIPVSITLLILLC